MNENLRLSDKGAKLIQAFESLLAPTGSGTFRGYFDPVGVLTIGWGHTNLGKGMKFTVKDIWSRALCESAFTIDMEDSEQAVRRLVRVPLSQHQFDGLISFVFNLGAGNFGGSTLLRMLNAGNYGGAAAQFQRWNRAGGKVLNGLVRRRASESLLFRGIPDNNYDGIPDKPVGPMAQRIDIPVPW